MGQQEEERQTQLRKKIWEIDERYKCAVIGTCLSRSEMHKLSKERVFSIDPDSDDYQLHSQFVRISQQHDLKGKSLHRYLEKKYRAGTGKYFRVATDTEIEALWKEDLTDGRVDSAWWAIMTHPRASMELVGRIYGLMHMLGHDCVGNYHKKKTLLRDLRAKVMTLEEVMGSERQTYLREKRQFKEKISALEMEIDGLEASVRENQFLREEVASLNKRILGLTAAEAEERQGQQSRGNFDGPETALNDSISEINAELELLKEEYGIAIKKSSGMEDQLCKFEQQKADQAKETAALEGMLQLQMAKETPCLICADQHTENCPGQNLCGRTILYVGGLNKMVPLYRQLVENFGGRFMHHDGGKEASRNLLPKMLVTADAVFCPIDCVSHDACNCVKKICKRYQKPFVLMRSASLSSLAKGLTDIAQ